MSSAAALSFIEVSKLVATGNDFVFIDGLNSNGVPSGIQRDELARRVCDRHNGVGADGLVIVEKGASEGSFKWDFYNSDGSFAEMCGNATRCFGRWLRTRYGLSEARLQTAAGEVFVRSEGDQIASELSFVRPTPKEIRFTLPDHDLERTAVLVNTGVPHVVYQVAQIDSAYQSKDVISQLRFHPETGARGANVTFLEIQSTGKFATVSFERGVEGFTLSCGTGVLAAATVGLKVTGGHEAIVSTPGGILRVSYHSDRPGVTLSGPALFLFTAHLQKEEFVK